jgi:hypothetical protein
LPARAISVATLTQQFAAPSLVAFVCAEALVGPDPVRLYFDNANEKALVLVVVHDVTLLRRLRWTPPDGGSLASSSDGAPGNEVACSPL